ncbi:hypothetical protein PT974_08972 [Cladobotryum mycophilum]|uniref:Pre-mRNA splicing factor CLF1 n=1 Tax=Cladobotryum mycophilum TaxID=491253 RepID=A0ABR0SEX0_9HYPO
MSVPKPPTSLDSSCSVIHDNTLYSYSSQGFLSLHLEEGAKWEKLDMGEKVMGATCVGTTPGDASQAGLFIVGGKSDSSDYPGLQKFTYSTGKWSTITLSDPDMKGRQWHGSTYIQADDLILVYGGSQNGVQGLSSQTFTIKASEPHDFRGYQSSAAPAVSPILMSWSSADAAMMSGDGTSGNIYWFNPTAGWRASGASLVQPVQKASGSMDAVLMTGADGSKNIYTFDLAQSPNHVSRTVVQDASGKPIINAAPINARSLEEDFPIERRDLTLDNWPKYNSTLAPKAARQNFAMAQGSDGMVIFSGGNVDDPMSMFDATHNNWVNTTEFFVGQTQSILSVPTTTTTQPLSTSTSLSTSATLLTTSQPTDLAVPPMQTSPSNNSGPTANAILGITLGTIAGFLVLLGLILFLLRQRRRRQVHTEAGHARRASGTSAEEKEIMGFATTTLPPPSPGYFRGHQHQMSQESTSSMAILMGRVGQHKPRKVSGETIRSSTSSMHKQIKGSISKPIPQVQQNPILQVEDDKGVATTPVVAEPRVLTSREPPNDATRRSSGWNRYWSGGSALNILGFGASKRNTVLSEHSSRYSQEPNNHRGNRDSATVPPLSFEGRPELSRVNSGSPVVSTYPSHVPWKEGITGRIEGNRPISAVTSNYSSGVPESVNEAWDPAGVGKPWGTDRAPSSVYAPSTGSAQPAPLGLSKQPQLVMATTSTDMSWLNLGDERAKH